MAYGRVMDQRRRDEMRKRTSLGVAIAAALLLVAGCRQTDGEGAGADGAGDEYFPYSGNGGYDVQHYDLDITYEPPAPAPARLRRVSGRRSA